VDSIRVEIEDNGRGIAQKDLSNIFDRFFRTKLSWRGCTTLPLSAAWPGSLR
jgi:signal transduction histidine kinase